MHSSHSHWKNKKNKFIGQCNVHSSGIFYITDTLTQQHHLKFEKDIYRSQTIPTSRLSPAQVGQEFGSS